MEVREGGPERSGKQNFPRYAGWLLCELDDIAKSLKDSAEARNDARTRDHQQDL
jgi:hypothetical protein